MCWQVTQEPFTSTRHSTRRKWRSFAPLSTRADLIANRGAVGVIHDRFVKMVAQGMTLEQIRAARASQEYDARFAG